LTDPRGDYEALDAQLREERRRVAVERAVLEEELDRLRRRGEELERALAQNAPGVDGGRPKLWVVCKLLLIAVFGVGQFALFQLMVAPSRCESICASRGLSFVNLVKRGGGGQGGNVLVGCGCTGERTRGPACRREPRPGVHVCDDGVTFSLWLWGVRMVGSIALPMLLVGLLGRLSRGADNKEAGGS
jgi:hypothetical protein